MLRLMYPSRTREALSVYRTSNVATFGSRCQTAFKITAVEPPQSLLCRSPTAPGRDVEWLPDGRTRLITRLKARYEWKAPLSALLSAVLLESGDLPMMRKMLRGMKARAEGR